MSQFDIVLTPWDQFDIVLTPWDRIRLRELAMGMTTEEMTRPQPESDARDN